MTALLPPPSIATLTTRPPRPSRRRALSLAAVLPLSILLACGDSMRIKQLESLPNAAVLRVRLPEPGAVTGQCTLDGDAREVHVFAADAAEELEIRLDGLLSEADYRCALSADALGLDGEILIETDAPAPDVPDDLVLAVDEGLDDGSMYGAYTLLNHASGNRGEELGRVLIVDPEGRVRWSYELDEVTVDVDATLTPDRQILVGGGEEMAPMLVGLAGNVLYDASPPLSGGSWHHHVGLAPSGHYYALTSETNTTPDPPLRFSGFQIEERDPATDTVLWSWRSQTAVDDGTLVVPQRDDGEAFHANSIIAENPADPGGVWVNLRNLSAILRIEKATGAVTWLMGAGSADFALVDASGDPAPVDQWFYGQHAPELVGDTLYVYDNGTGRPGGWFSRVVAYRIDLEARTLRQEWAWTEPGWYEGLWGDVDLLPNGHVLFTSGHCDDCEGGGTTVSSWTELDRDTGPVWRLKAPNLDHNAYRAQRVEGCDVFRNARYCPQLLP